MKLLDLCCSAGGASTGYARAGFEVTGVDIDPQPNYPFEFIQADAIQYLREHGHEYDVIHMSPPCQRFSTMTRRHGDAVVETWPDLIAPLRTIMQEQFPDKPYIIENVPSAPLIDPITLCGTMFDLTTEFEGNTYTLRRHRKFETNWGLTAPAEQPHTGLTVGVYGHPGGRSNRDGLRFPLTANWREVMGIDWMTVHELAESIPPVYTEYIGQQLWRTYARTH